MNTTDRLVPHADPASRRRRPSGRTLAAAGLIPLSLVLAACGSASATSAGTTSSGSSQNAGSGGAGVGQGNGAGGTGFPGASGLIAAASPGTLQVQSATSQTAVTYGASTKFSKTVTGTVAIGDCVTVSGAPVIGSSDVLTATTVRIQAKVNGACPAPGSFNRGGFGGGSGSASGGTGSGYAPSGAPSGGTRPAGSFANASGTVTSVNGPTVVVEGVLREGRPAAGAATPATVPITVTLGSTTAVTTTVPATSAAAVVGQCATALGTADSQGAIAATSITISAPGATGCRSGFGRIGGGSGSGA